MFWNKKQNEKLSMAPYALENMVSDNILSSMLKQRVKKKGLNRVRAWIFFFFWKGENEKETDIFGIPALGRLELCLCFSSRV